MDTASSQISLRIYSVLYIKTVPSAVSLFSTLNLVPFRQMVLLKSIVLTGSPRIFVDEGLDYILIAGLYSVFSQPK